MKLFLERVDNSGEVNDEQEEDGKAKHGQDIQRIIDLGLGRGVDATVPTPWLDKSSFQVRPVTDKTIIRTEEGGCVQAYKREVTSVSEIHGRVSASITNPKMAVTVGVEGEYSQSSSKGYKVIGTKVTVLNRTISFKDHCDDGSLSFEIWLCKWILDKKGSDICSEIIKLQQELDNKADSKHRMKWQSKIVELESELVNLNGSMESLRNKEKELQEQTERRDRKSVEDTMRQTFKQCMKNEVIEYCSKFIAHFHITHYVSSIQLGASEYDVLTESEIAKRLGSEGQMIMTT